MLLPENRRQSAQCLVYRGAVREHIQDLRVDHGNVGALSVSCRGHTSNSRGEVVLWPHGVMVVFRISTTAPLLHSASAHAGSPASRVSAQRPRFPAVRFRRPWRRAVPVAASAVSTKNRSARFTDSAFGNTSASSGSTNTRLVPPLACRWYFPRTPPLSCERSYSGRKSSSNFFVDAFFILPALSVYDSRAGNATRTRPDVWRNDRL